jgi:probable rRNA maturation factor
MAVALLLVHVLTLAFLPLFPDHRRPLGPSMIRTAPACAGHHAGHQTTPQTASDDLTDEDEDEQDDDYDVSLEELERAMAAAIAAAESTEREDAMYDDDAAEVRILIDDSLGDPEELEIDVGYLGSRCEAILAAAGRDGWGLNVRLTGDDEVQMLNRVHRGMDAPTDILSFAPPPDDDDVLRARPPALLGDLAISVPYVERSCAEDAALSDAARAADVARGGAYGRLATERSLEGRLLLLIAHGVCHLLGFNHDADDDHARMLRMEDELIRAALAGGGGGGE